MNIMSFSNLYFSNTEMNAKKRACFVPHDTGALQALPYFSSMTTYDSDSKVLQILLQR